MNDTDCTDATSTSIDMNHTSSSMMVNTSQVTTDYCDMSAVNDNAQESQLQDTTVQNTTPDTSLADIKFEHSLER